MDAFRPRALEPPVSDLVERSVVQTGWGDLHVARVLALGGGAAAD